MTNHECKFSYCSRRSVGERVNHYIQPGRNGLPRAIESVLAQRTTFPFEIVIGDDGSSDDSLKVAMVLSEGPFGDNSGYLKEARMSAFNATPTKRSTNAAASTLLAH